MSNSNGRILILDAELVGHQLLLINIYNANTETEQIQTRTTLSNMIISFDFSQLEAIKVFRHFNLLYNKLLKASGGNPKTKILSSGCVKSKYSLYCTNGAQLNGQRLRLRNKKILFRARLLAMSRNQPFCSNCPANV